MFTIIIGVKYDKLAAEHAGIMFMISDQERGREELKEFANIMRFGSLGQNGGGAGKLLNAKTPVSGKLSDVHEIC